MRLTPLDATFLELEDANAAAHMHVGAVLVFEGRAPSTERVVAGLESRLPALPRFRQRLSEPGHGTLRRPTWVDDEHFRAADHVRRAALPRPGGRRELEELAAEFWSHRLDRDRPLWELLIVEGLDADRWAFVTKTHHCLVDGVAAVDAGYLMLDGIPAPERPEPSAHHHAPPNPVHALEAARAIADLAIRDGLTAAPHCSLTAPIGPRRRFRSVAVSLADVKAVKRRLGGTVNDVVLALVAGALRRMLVARGEALPAGGLRVMVPVDLRSAGGHGDLGNQVSAFFVPLAVAESDPLDRYHRVVRAAEERKRGGEAAGSAGLLAASGWAPPVAHGLVGLPFLGRRLFNLTVTNVRGPAERVSAFGSPMREIMPLVPLAADHALGVAVVSYEGRLFFGLIADRDSVDDLDVAVDGIERSLDELLRAAGVRRRRRAAA